MKKDDIIKSGFHKAFIYEYVELYAHHSNMNKSKLIYSLCDTVEEKQEATFSEIKKIKERIKKLNFNELSTGYLFSTNPKHHEFIKHEKRNEFWIEKFTLFFEESIISFTPILDLLIEQTSYFEKISKKEEKRFWASYPNELKPNKKNLYLNINSDINLIKQIETEIKNFNENEFWSIEIDNYKDFTDYNFSIKILFDLCELLSLHNLLEIFLEFKEIEEKETTINSSKKEEVSIEKEKTIEEILTENLTQYNFFELPKVKNLSINNKSTLISLIKNNKTPYKVAMLEYLGFFNYLNTEYCNLNLHTTFIKVAQIINKGRNDRAIKGNYYVLTPNSTENRKRYTAHKHKETVKKDYEKLN